MLDWGQNQITTGNPEQIGYSSDFILNETYKNKCRQIFETMSRWANFSININCMHYFFFT